MIRILIDGSEYCEKCARRCDSNCKQCDEYKYKEDYVKPATISSALAKSVLQAVKDDINNILDDYIDNCEV